MYIFFNIPVKRIKVSAIYRYIYIASFCIVSPYTRSKQYNFPDRIPLSKRYNIFYYHFEGIPDMIQWSIKQGTRRLLEACKEQGGAEAALKYLFVFAINAIPEVRKGIESNYGKELEQTLMQGTYQLFESIVEEENLYQNYSRQELKLILRYHSHAIFGILQDWTPEDTKNLDMIVHEVYLIMMGKNAPGEL